MSELNKYSASESPFKGKNKYAVFCGRWQPAHLGHMWLISQKLDKGIPVLILVRDIEPDDKNPFTTEETVRLLEKIYVDKDVKVMIIPDIESISWGRGVGYEVNEFTPPEDIKMISATFIRNSIKEGNNEWKEYVHKSIHEDILNYLVKYYNI